MLGKSVSKEHFQPRTCSGKKPLKTGQDKGNLEDIVFIDLDSDQFDDVEIIDCPEVVTQKLRGSSGTSRGRISTPQSVISIDDDDDDESDDVYDPEIFVDGVGELDSDASSNKRFYTASRSMQHSVVVDVDDVVEKDSVSKRQKSDKASVSNGKKREEVFTPKPAERNCYGLFESESDSDCSDCEVIKREQWEKVSAKRKFRVFNEHASSSGLQKNIYNNIDIEVENRSSKHGKDHLYGPSSSKNVKENQSSFTVKDDIRHGEKTTKEKVYPCPKLKNCNFCNGVTGPSGLDNERGDEESEFKDATRHGERTTTEKVSACPNSENSNFSNGVTGPSGLDNERGDEKSEFKDATRHGERTTTEKVHARPNSENSNFSNGVTGPSGFEKELGDKEKFMSSNQDVQDMQVDDNESPLNAHDRQVDDDESPLNAHDRQIDNDESPSRSKNDNISKGNFNGTSFEKIHFNGPEFELRTQDADLNASNEKNIINQKEKLKETDLYKQAMEEEWASRQRQLQIQSEEAQKLRKRKKAESRRLQDIERRQKERVEEVRETDKKEEEYMNMKEQLRGEVLKKLNQLENECSDMTSLLRGLGITVGTSLRPLPNEVHAAYKRAMFKFHPDRASKTDLREHVEAEEKCKLISRMKEKFCNTSWH
ncbi:unnamed protein product [Lathyrus sativus]|nr:unnamed protein product [Lathyrus sativus]